MAKINLVIADNDLDYLKEISKFLLSNFSQKFQLSSFSNNDELLSYVNSERTKIDVLLISPNLYTENIKKDIFGVIIIFTAGIPLRKDKNFKYINKYQKGDDILNKIINIYSENSKDILFSGIISKETKIIAVYSASGGAGKSLISVASSICLSMKGLKVLYLNFEIFQSTHHYFKSNSDNNLSNLFYFIKNEKIKLVLKIEETRNIDINTGIHYFTPPESALEIEELGTEEIRYLLNEIKEKCIYDVVFVDMSVSFDKRNIEVLNEADDIFLVFSTDATSIMKFKSLMHQLESLNNKTGSKMSDKLSFIENKIIGNSKTENRERLFSIPFINELSSNEGQKNILGINDEFDEVIGKLNEKFFKG